MSLVKLKKTLKVKWRELEKSSNNIFVEWDAFLTELGMIESITFENRWNSSDSTWHSSRTCIKEIQKIVNKSNKPLYIVTSPNKIDNIVSEILIFDREKVTKKLIEV